MGPTDVFIFFARCNHGRATKQTIFRLDASQRRIVSFVSIKLALTLSLMYSIHNKEDISHKGPPFSLLPWNASPPTKQFASDILAASVGTVSAQQLVVNLPILAVVLVLRAELSST